MYQSLQVQGSYYLMTIFPLVLGSRGMRGGDRESAESRRKNADRLLNSQVRAYQPDKDHLKFLPTYI